MCRRRLLAALVLNAGESGVRPGTEMQFHSSAQGKAARAFSRQRLMKWVRGRDLERFTEHTVCDYDKLEARSKSNGRQPPPGHLLAFMREGADLRESWGSGDES